MMRNLISSLALLTALAAGPALACVEGDCPAEEGVVGGAGSKLVRGADDGSLTGTATQRTGFEETAGTAASRQTAQQKAAADALRKLVDSAKKKRTSTATSTAAGTAASGEFGAQHPAGATAANGRSIDENPGASNGRAHEQQIAREILGDDSDAPVGHRVARLHAGGEKALYNGVVMVATGITQLSLAEQDRAEFSDDEENTQVREAATQNIANGAQQIETGRATIGYGNEVARHENRRASVGASGAMPIHDATFDPGRATPEANQKLEEMERVAGVPASALIEAVNAGGGREEIVSLAGGAKGVSQGASAEVYAAIPNFGTSQARSSGGSSAPPPVSTWNHAPAPAAVASKKAPVPERKVASTAPPPARAEPEHLQSLGADNLLRSLGAKQIASSAPVREEKSLFQRVSRQLSKRYAELR